jgi:hypothetical protein
VFPGGSTARQCRRVSSSAVQEVQDEVQAVRRRFGRRPTHSHCAGPGSRPWSSCRTVIRP